MILPGGRDKITNEIWKSEKNIFTVDYGGKRMFYRFTPATETLPHLAPTMLLLHGHGSTNPSRFRNANWNAIAPVDNFGEKKSWILVGRREWRLQHSAFVGRSSQRLRKKNRT